MPYALKRAYVVLRRWWASDELWLFRLRLYFLKNPRFYLEFRKAKKLRAQGLAEVKA